MLCYRVGEVLCCVIGWVKCGFVLCYRVGEMWHCAVL